jgi:uncharacterized protein YacL (UPF0231 family)
MTMTDMIDIKDELTKLMSSFDEANTEWKNKKKEVEVAYRKQSDIVEAVAKALGSTKKFKWKGMELTIVIKGGTFFFRGLPKDTTEDMLEIG